jgi:hypothetical protein
MHFSYHTIYLFVSFLPIKFNEASLIGEYSIDDIDNRKEFPLKKKIIFLAKLFISLLEKKKNWGKNIFKKNINAID